MGEVFSAILAIEKPQRVSCRDADGLNEAVEIRFEADGEIPFPQVIVWAGVHEHLYYGSRIDDASDETHAHRYVAHIPAGEFGPGEYTLQVEGCRRADIEYAGADDWIKRYERLRVAPADDVR